MTELEIIGAWILVVLAAGLLVDALAKARRVRLEQEAINRWIDRIDPHGDIPPSDGGH